MIKIEKNVPYRGMVLSKTKFPFMQMKVGDSFLVPKKITRNVVSTSASYYGRTRGIKFATKTTPEGLRCWRIK